MVRALAANDHLPGYSVGLDDHDMVRFSNRDQAPPIRNRTVLREATYLEARDCAPGWDIYLIEQHWREWSTEKLRDPDASFLGFCRTWYAKRGAA